MSRRRIAAIALAATMVVGLHTATAADPIVAIEVQSKSWIKGSTFDLEHFKRQCQGVTLVAPGSPDATAVARLRYEEAKGPGFSMFGVGKPAGYGTDVSLALALFDRRVPKPRVTLVATGATPAGLPVDRFHSAALAAFHESAPYTLACSVIAAALGSRQAMLTLLPWAVLDAQGRTIVDTIGFTPASDIERAYVAVAHRDFETIKMLGASALEPLLIMFVNTSEPRNGAGRLSFARPGNVQALLDAVPILDAQSDGRILDALMDFLTDQGNLQSADADPDHPAIPVVRSVLSVIGRHGDSFVLPLLDEWTAAGGPAAGDATSAAAALRKRLAIE